MLIGMIIVIFAATSGVAYLLLGRSSRPSDPVLSRLESIKGIAGQEDFAAPQTHKRGKKKEKKEAAKKAVAPETSVETKAESEWLSSPKLGNYPKLNTRLPLDLEIKALDAVWVHVTCDGSVLFQGILKKGAAESWKAKETIEIWTGNASSSSLATTTPVNRSTGAVAYASTAGDRAARSARRWGFTSMAW